MTLGIGETINLRYTSCIKLSIFTIKQRSSNSFYQQILRLLHTTYIKSLAFETPLSQTCKRDYRDGCTGNTYVIS